MEKQNEATGTATRQLVITRVFDAPRELVWKAWTEPERVMQWWGPRNFTSPACKIDLRVGGKYLFCMRTADGKDLWSTGTYLEIEVNKKIVCTDAFSDEEGNIVSPTVHGISPDFPEEIQVTLRLEDYPEEGGNQTKLTIAYEEAKTEAAFKTMLETGMVDGWNESLDKLAEYLAR